MISRALNKWLCILVVCLSFLGGCSTYEGNQSKGMRVKAVELAQRRFAELNSDHYMLQVRGTSGWDSGMKTWKVTIEFLSVPGRYEAWVDPTHQVIVKEQIVGSDGKSAMSLDEVVPHDFPKR